MCKNCICAMQKFKKLFQKIPWQALTKSCIIIKVYKCTEIKSRGLIDDKFVNY